MAHPKEDIKKQTAPAYEESNTQASASEGNKKQTSSIEELKKQAAAYETLKKQIAYYEELNKPAAQYDEVKKQAGFSYSGEVPFASQLNTLREKLDMLASDPNSDLNEIAQCINAITFFENQQSKRIAEMRKETHRSSELRYDNQSILQTSSVRKKEPRAVDTNIRESELQKTKQ